MKTTLAIAFLAATSMTFVGCKSESPKAPSKKSNPKDPAEDANPSPQGTEDESPAGVDLSEQDGLGLEPDSFTGNTFDTPSGQQATLTFRIVGADGADIDVGLDQGPTGSSVAVSGDKVTFVWPNPIGTEKVVFILRNVEDCEDENSGNCGLSDAPGSSTFDSAYDTRSQEFTITTDGSSGDSGIDNGVDPNNGFGGGGGGGIADQIKQLLGGGGGGGIDQLLKGLSGGQLQQILQQLQGGGGGGGIGQLLGILGNIT